MWYCIENQFSSCFPPAALLQVFTREYRKKNKKKTCWTLSTVSIKVILFERITFEGPDEGASFVRKCNAAVSWHSTEQINLWERQSWCVEDNKSLLRVFIITLYCSIEPPWHHPQASEDPEGSSKWGAEASLISQASLHSWKLPS